MNKRTKGFTLLELVIVLVISAIVIGGALPSMTQSVRNNTVASQNLSIISMLNFARSEAIRRNTDVTLELTAVGNTWSAVIEDPNNEVAVEGCVVGQLRCTSQSGVALTASANTIVFNNRGYIRDNDDAWTAETLYLQHQHCSGQNQRSRINITPTGQVSSCSLACNSTETC